MDTQASRVTEDQFLGALVGMAIGDALGGPLRGMSADEIRAQHGEITGYIAGERQPKEGASPIGMISDKSEIVLCIVESLTTNDGVFDFENINARMSFVARSASSKLMSEATIRGIERATELQGVVEVDGDDPEELAVATRGIPFGLVHSIGEFDREGYVREASLAARLSHRGAAASRLTTEVGLLVAGAARRPDNLAFLQSHDDVVTSSVRQELAAISAAIAASDTFETGVFAVVSRGGDADAAGAIAGAIAGARFGASGIPQGLIDDLDARIYLTLAAPWFYRTALRRQGTVIDLRTVSEQE